MHLLVILGPTFENHPPYREAAWFRATDIICRGHHTLCLPRSLVKSSLRSLVGRQASVSVLSMIVAKESRLSILGHVHDAEAPREKNTRDAQLGAEEHAPM